MKAVNHRSGFTLIEILVVLAIIAFSANLIVYSIDDSRHDELEQTAFALQTSINFASEYAILNQRQLGLFVDDENGYEFMVYGEQKWQALDDSDGVLKGKKLESDFSLTLNQEDLPWAQDSLLNEVDWQKLLGADDDDFLELQKMQIPQVMILSSGEISPFQLRLALQDADEDLAPFIIEGEFMAPVSLYQEELQ
ncbi:MULTISPECIES: type II secretion system minor pseudopilin GspH [unclassified Pseudoalteromonas]|uniref:type II secretion system minor pseudopilin GspH n=1 Tax=unclassified Pseudoalteromonas TaxID=194690 RepID=UPI000CF610E2|nr:MULTISPECIES: type II secretion system minor pseudopilin GspH [unclassified Pseudoalteromonas]